MKTRPHCVGISCLYDATGTGRMLPNKRRFQLVPFNCACARIGGQPTSLICKRSGLGINNYAKVGQNRGNSATQKVQYLKKYLFATNKSYIFVFSVPKSIRKIYSHVPVLEGSSGEEIPKILVGSVRMEGSFDSRKLWNPENHVDTFVGVTRALSLGQMGLDHLRLGQMGLDHLEFDGADGP